MARPLRPKDAATLVLIRRRAGEPEVLLGQRHGRHAFMPHRFVFPGGQVDPGDSRVRPASPLRPDVARRLERGCSPARARALAVACVRETFEECGLMLAAPMPDGLPTSRRQAWAEFADQGLGPALGALDYVCRAITPPGRPRRFDARFFLADAAHLRGEIRSNGELLDIQWAPLSAARALPIPTITRLVIEETARLIATPPPPGTPRTIPVYRHRYGRDLYMRE